MNKSDDLRAKLTKVTLLQEQTFLQEELRFHSDFQDEVDKQSISLYGIEDERHLLKLEQNCQSCNGSLNFTKKAFKMACLKYIPSKVLVDGVVKTRAQILEKREQLIEHQREILHQLLKRAPFKEREGTPQLTNIVPVVPEEC
jgi:hypothetical protein